MSEAEKTFDMIRRAFATADPDCHVVFEITTVGNDNCYYIGFDEIDSEAVWIGDEEFLNGDAKKLSLRNTMETLVDLCGTECVWRGFAARHPDVMRVCETICESDSFEELKLRLSVKGLL